MRERERLRETERETERDTQREEEGQISFGYQHLVDKGQNHE